MKVCVFGSYERAYSRNRILIKGLKKSGIEVAENNVNHSFIIRQLTLLKNFILNQKDFEFIFIMHTGRKDIILAFVIAKLFRKKIVFDAFFSGYNTIVETRKLVNPLSPKAKIYWYVDKICCLLSDIVLLDTNAHIDYFVKTFHSNPKKFKRIFIGSDEDIFKPVENTTKSDFNADYFTIWWHGTYIPGHGVDIIIRSAKLLENYPNIQFLLSGQGQLFDEITELASSLKLSNVKFNSLGSYEKLASSMRVADICLGVFVSSIPKYTWVIPNKCFEAAAMSKPLISGISIGIQEAFTHKENIYLCKMSDPEDLANSILELISKPSLRHSISQNAYFLFSENFTSKEIGKKLKLILDSEN